jgi:flagellar biogenesis protein FliO
MSAEVILQLIQGGMSAVMLFILSQVWAEMKIQNQFQRDLIKRQFEADLERAELKGKVDTITTSHKTQS